jgi:hypothetical protein
VGRLVVLGLKASAAVPVTQPLNGDGHATDSALDAFQIAMIESNSS